LLKIEQTRFKEHVITKIILSGGIYGSIANTPPSSFTLYHDTQRVHTYLLCQQRYWEFLGHPVRYERNCLSNHYFLIFHRIFRDILFHCCV